MGDGIRNRATGAKTDRGDVEEKDVRGLRGVADHAIVGRDPWDVRAGSGSEKKGLFAAGCARGQIRDQTPKRASRLRYRKKRRRGSDSLGSYAASPPPVQMTGTQICTLYQSRVRVGLGFAGVSSWAVAVGKARGSNWSRGRLHRRTAAYVDHSLGLGVGESVVSSVTPRTQGSMSGVPRIRAERLGMDWDIIFSLRTLRRWY